MKRYTGNYFSSWYQNQKFDSAKIHRAFIAQSHTTFIAVAYSLFLTSLYCWFLSSHYNFLKLITCLLRGKKEKKQKTKNLVVFSLKCLKLVKIHHPLKQPYPSIPPLLSKPYHIYLPIIITALQSNSTLKISMARISYNVLNQPNFSLKVKGRWFISRVPNQNFNDPQYELWDKENFMVMSWLLCATED